ncbi:MAG TPA: VWA domain-containing protein, partial [Nannocystis sp.]
NDPDNPQTAVPPVRLREFAEAFQVGDERNVFSICQDDYSAALQAIANKIRDQIKPACMPKCVRDLDPTTEILEPSCEVYEVNTALGTRDELPPCELVDGAWVPPAGETACFAELIDPDGSMTPSPLDDMHPDCTAKGYNLQFEVVRTAGAPAGTTVQAYCELSQNKAQDCPNM